MLTEVKLENFRVFDKEVTFRLRPITVLIGRNSAGKSTLIKFLLMLQQSLGATESRFLTPDGELVRLGALSDLRNTVSRRPFFDFHMKFQGEELPSRLELAMLKAFQEGKIKVDPVTQKSDLRLRWDVVDRDNVRGGDEAAFDVFARIPYSPSLRKGEHSVCVTVAGETRLKSASTNLRRTQFLRFPRRLSDPNKLFESLLTEENLEPLRAEIRSWRHLLPIRADVERRPITSGSPPVDDVSQKGEYAVNHLQQIVEEGGGRLEFVLKHLRAVTDISKVRFEKRGFFATCRATNSRTHAEVYLPDFGFGVTQCIPIFVQGALMRENQLLMVEQPEAQLHPTAQIEMGSFFAELWSQRKVMSIIETHSPQIILRLRRHVAKGELKAEDVSIAYLFVNESGMPSVKNLVLDAAGNLEKGLPLEFFGADILESMKLGLKQ